MSAKILLVFCAQALFVQSALSQCISRAAVSADRGVIGPVGYGLGASYGFDGAYGLGAPWGLDGAYSKQCGFSGLALDFSPTSGGALPVTSSSAIPPVGLSVSSENKYEGKLAAAGELPFVGTVALEGVLPTAGAGAINHHCGDGINAMVSDKSGFGYDGAYGLGLTGAYDLGFAAPGVGYRAGLAGKGCGCGYL